MIKRVVILGAGGHGRVVADVLRATGHTFVGFVDVNEGSPQVLGEDSDLAKIIKTHKVNGFLIGVGLTTGGDGLRRRLFQTAREAELDPVTAIHCSAVISPYADIGAGTVVMPGVVVNAGALIGDNVILNTRAGVDHDCRIADDCHIAPGVTLCGDVHIARTTLIGAGTTAVPKVRVGANCTIGAGSLLLGRYGSGGTYVGSPARPK